MRKKFTVLLSSVFLLTSCSSVQKDDSSRHSAKQYAGAVIDLTVFTTVLLPVWLAGAAYEGAEDLVTTDRSEFTSSLKCLEPYNFRDISADYLENNILYVSNEYDCKKNVTVSFPDKNFYHFKKENTSGDNQGNINICNFERLSSSGSAEEKCSKLADFSIYDKNYVTL